MVRTINKVFDASVIIKWFIEEEGSDRADRYLQAYKDKQFSIFVPTLLFYELGNILLAKKATAKQVGQIMQNLHALNLIKTDIGYESFRKVFQNADELQITYYDASYLTLMQKESCEFVTADRKLHERTKEKFALVKLL